jgi:hypothetical protein
LIHASKFCPRVYPYNGDIAPAEIDRLQSLAGDITLNREKIKEIGNTATVDWRKKIPTLSLTGMQYEYGTIEFWRKLANKSDATTSITQDDFKTSMVDICGYKTDDDGDFIGTVWYPKLRLSRFGINIGDPEAYIERSFDLVGEDEILLLNNNKYFIYRKFTATGGTDEEFTISDGGTTYPDPVEDPDNSSTYLLRVLRVSGGETTELTEGTDYTYDSGTLKMTVSSTTVGDILKVYWSATTYITGEDPFTPNTTDASALSADMVSIYLATSNYLYRLQNVSIDVSLDRRDYKEVGNNTVTQRGIKDTTTTITLGRMLEAYTIEEVLRGVGGDSYGKIDARKYEDDVSLIVKVYSDDSKSTFKCRYDFSDLSPVGLNADVPVDEYITRNVNLECDNVTIKSTDA